MITPKKRPSLASKTPSISTPEKSDKRTVWVVFTATVTFATMKRSEQHLIGIFEDLAEAETLEKKFNEQAKEIDGAITKAFTIRYGVPYLAPIMKQMLENNH